MQRNNMSRPTGKSIYMQRREYSETLNGEADRLGVRVEHLFTCDMDGREVSSVSDCVAKLKKLDSKGRVWSQEMILELQGGYVVLSDIETKSELDSLSLSSVVETNAVLDACAYNSVLALTVQERNRRQVYMFQCEETGAEVLKADVDKAFQKGGGAVQPRPQRPADPPETRNNLENVMGSGGYRPEGPRAVLRDNYTPSPEPPLWSSREPGRYSPEAVYVEEPYDAQLDPPLLSDNDRNIEIFNHVLNDLEMFMETVTAAMNSASQKPEKKKSKKKKASKAKPADALPTWDEYVACLQKIKYGFNLLGQLDGVLNEPSAEDYVHILFNILAFLVVQYPLDIPPTVLSPLLSDATVQLLGSVVSAEEEELWVSLGETWTVPRSQWPQDEIPPYIPDFSDGWQPPSRSSRPVSRSNSQRFPPSQQQNGWGTPPPPARSTDPEFMRAIYDFMARNNRELNLMKDDVVEVVQKNRQWWLVRNNRGEEGHVPQKVLESMDRPQMGQMGQVGQTGQRDGPVNLDMRSSSAEVSNWLSYKGFSKMTVRTLGVLNGRQLLGMSKDDIRAVCPEDGGKVFFQLQAIKSAIALASEPSGPYDGRY